MSEITGGRTWLLGLLIVPSLLGFIFLDAGVGLLLGLATSATIIVIAARARPDGPIEIATAGTDVRAGLLVIVLAPIEEPRAAAIIAEIGHPARDVSGEQGLLLLAPERIKVLDRWAGDLEQARFESQRVLAVSVATLAAAGVEAEGTVGDGDPLQATEDALRTYAATEVVVVAEPGDHEKAIAALERRLPVPLRRLSVAADQGDPGSDS